MLTDIGGSIPLWVTPFHKQVVLGYIRKLAKHECANKPTSNITTWVLF